ncbi:deoxyribodipyrimidine photo-lyase [Pseudoruegeria sp. SK021]|uniref:cryptochrome/photolyase family protein n=1 Tax=Pseudoruegeria sp. SK021 TaxID=1933035 RepID=UPI000A2322DB|nr:deoxyribodipyrimidine photo-lyase [Pseudoruegeria sp. SK021]OSP55631.1 deoxyribodipyrimidine photolyase [Pseudoruegeria sp. SK021]
MADRAPVIWWVRRDLRLADNPALTAAVATGRPVIPVFVLDAETEDLGAAPRWRLGLGLDVFATTLNDHGSGLVLRRGVALDCLRALIAETGAKAVYWSRLVDPAAIARDTAVKTALTAEGVEARSFSGHLLFDPWTVATKTGGYYRVFTPYWRNVRDRPVAEPQPAPCRWPSPERWPASDDLNAWQLGAGMHRGAAIVARHARPGAEAAQDRLDTFLETRVATYAQDRDRPALDGTSGLSEHLTYGEISPATCWHAARRALYDGVPGTETFLRELAWRDFAHHLAYHTPHLITGNWKPDWDGFPWTTDASDPAIRAWQQGRTGIPFVDAGMRELYVTGTMHNRARMITASYLTKHLLAHWKIGQAWFAACLIDWDPASNAMGWQWVAGSGPDASPYFRIFNPVTQLDKFDPKGGYADRWIAEGRSQPAPEALSYFEAIPQSWGMSPTDPYPDPVISLKDGRDRALEAYAGRKTDASDDL